MSRQSGTAISQFLCLLLLIGPSWAFAQSAQMIIPCPSDLQDVVNDDLSELVGHLEDAVSHLEDGDFEAQTKVAKWLGARNADDAEDIGEVLESASAFADTVAFLCAPLTNLFQGPDGSYETIAYVYQAIPVIHLYGNYFELPDEGENSRQGALLHELTHLHLVGGTNTFDKETYDPKAALELARDDPEEAMRNAQGYTFFYEALVFDAWSDVN